jgi:hypothetical protein
VALLKYDIAPDDPLDIRWQGEHASDRHLIHEVFAPNWVDIKRAIRRLDGRRYTSVTLWPSAEREEHDPTGEFAYFSVTGGGTLADPFVEARERGRSSRHDSSRSARR